MNKFIKQAFTLIELLVVIAIIGILSGLIVVSMSGVTSKANIAKAQIFSNSLRNSLMLNIVGEWKFDGSTGDNLAATPNDVLDSWGGNITTVPVSPNTPTVRTGSNCVSGSCLSFDSGDSVGITTVVNYSDKASFGAWINTSFCSNSAWNFIIEGNSCGGDVLFGIINDNSGKVNFGGECNVPFGGVSSAVSVCDGKWHYVVGTYDKYLALNQAKIYVDGLLSNQKNASGSFVSTASMSFGRGNGAQKFTGLMDEIRIYNAAVPTSEIKEQYYLGLNSLLANGNISKEDYKQRLVDLLASK
ncbi:MAG: LamG-like jellyroll fold domain-containing protein [Candidatus Paceibacterota bacterium]|jgi:prepilin-type N-terminal cleavage/methylation domain-containing protein